MSLSSRSLAFVAELVQRRSGIVVSADKDYLVVSRLTPIARDQGFKDVDGLVDELRRRRRHGLEARIVEAMTTNETTFYRDVHPFRTLQNKLIPELLEANKEERTLSIWSAAASTGQEVYTLAIMLREHFPQLRSWKLTLHASDLSAEVIAKARTGRYAQHEVNRGLPATMLVKYFRKDDQHWQLKDEIRSMVTFREVNLINRWPSDYPKFDLVLLRNVLIYFDEATKIDILKRLERQMAPHGILMLGAAETTMGLDETYQRVLSDTTSYYRLSASRQESPNGPGPRSRLQVAG